MHVTWIRKLFMKTLWRRSPKSVLVYFLYSSIVTKCCYTLSFLIKHINVESTLKKRLFLMFVNFVSTLLFDWKLKLSRRMFIDVISVLKWGRLFYAKFDVDITSTDVSTLFQHISTLKQRWVFRRFEFLFLLFFSQFFHVKKKGECK